MSLWGNWGKSPRVFCRGRGRGRLIAPCGGWSFSPSWSVPSTNDGTPKALAEDIDLYRTIAEKPSSGKGAFLFRRHPTDDFGHPSTRCSWFPAKPLGKFAWWGIAGLHLGLGVAYGPQWFFSRKRTWTGRPDGSSGTARRWWLSIQSWSAIYADHDGNNCRVFRGGFSVGGNGQAVARLGNSLGGMASGIFAGIAALTRATPASVGRACARLHRLRMRPRKGSGETA